MKEGRTKSRKRKESKGRKEEERREVKRGIKSFYENASASVWVNGELSESFVVKVGVRQGCVMSPWMCNIYMDGCKREIKVGVRDLGGKLNVRGGGSLWWRVYMWMTQCCWLKVWGCFRGL